MDEVYAHFLYAESLKAEAIATPDLRHFGAVRIRGAPKLIPRDL